MISIHQLFNFLSNNASQDTSATQNKLLHSVFEEFLYKKVRNYGIRQPFAEHRRTEQLTKYNLTVDKCCKMQTPSQKVAAWKKDIDNDAIPHSALLLYVEEKQSWYLSGWYPIADEYQDGYVEELHENSSIRTLQELNDFLIGKSLDAVEKMLEETKALRAYNFCCALTGIYYSHINPVKVHEK